MKDIKDLIEEHDYYNKLRSKHIEKLTKENKEKEKRQKQKQHDLLFAWKKEGEATFLSLQKQTNHLHLLLTPYRVMKECILLLNQIVSSCQLGSNTQLPIYLHRISRKLLKQLHFQQQTCHSHHLRYSRPMNPTEIIQWKLSLHKEYLRRLNQDYLPPGKQFYFTMEKEIKIFRHLFRYYARKIHITPKTLIELNKKRYVARMAERKYKMIKQTQQQCDAISVCKSIQHYHPKGCTNCGVIFIGGSLEGAVPYVKSLSRDTGVATLVTLAFEIETLENEEKIQDVVLEKATKDLQQYESNVYGELILSLQQFWRMVLIWKRMKKRMMQQNKSIYYYRIRRLVKMKREIDRLIKEPPAIDMAIMLDKYWDIAKELEEYVTKQQNLKHERILKYAKRFHGNLVVVLEVARERKYQEWLRLQSLPKPPRPLIIKTLPPKKKESYTCYRTECHFKQFLSYERYRTHMEVHKQQDYIQYYKHRLARLQKNEKLKLENTLLENIQYVKSNLRPVDHTLQIEYPTNTAASHELSHQYNLYRILTTSIYSLTLVSKSSDVTIPNSEILLDQQVMRIGTHSSCECSIGTKGEIARLGMISKIHCLLYHAPPSAEREEEEDDERDLQESKITIVDNSSLFGTYVVAKDGATKVPTKVSKGLVIQNGSLICVGVTIDGPPILPVSEANSACLVFRLQMVTV